MFGILKKIVTLPIDVAETAVKTTTKTTKKVFRDTGVDNVVEELEDIFGLRDDEDD